MNQNHWDLLLVEGLSPSTGCLQGNASQVLDADGFSLFDGVSSSNPNQTGHGTIPTAGRLPPGIRLIGVQKNLVLQSGISASMTSSSMGNWNDCSLPKILHQNQFILIFLFPRLTFLDPILESSLCSIKVNSIALVRGLGGQ